MTRHDAKPMSPRSLLAGAAAAMLLAACSPSAVDETVPVEVVADVEAVAAAATQLCPLLWDWVKDVGGIMNGLSAFGVEEPDVEVRKTFYADQIDRISGRSAELDVALAQLDDPILEPLILEVRTGLVRAAGYIEEMRRSLDAQPEIDEMRPQVRISGLFIAAEKVIDAGKPRLGPYDDAILIAGFQQVRECQHSVKDVDDGVPRFNG